MYTLYHPTPDYTGDVRVGHRIVHVKKGKAAGLLPVVYWDLLAQGWSTEPPATPAPPEPEPPAEQAAEPERPRRRRTPDPEADGGDA